MPPTPKTTNIQHIKKMTTTFLKTCVILEGFRQTGYEIRIQRKKLVKTLVTNGFGPFFEKCQTSRLVTLKTY